MALFGGSKFFESAFYGRTLCHLLWDGFNICPILKLGVRITVAALQKLKHVPYLPQCLKHCSGKKHQGPAISYNAIPLKTAQATTAPYAK